MYPMNPASATFRRPTATGTANATIKATARFSRKMVQFSGTFAGGWSVDLQGSVDGEVWHPIEAGIVAATLVELVTSPTVDLHWNFMRVVANTVGTDTDEALTITLAGTQG